MQYKRLGNAGMPVSRLCLGTMTFGYQCDESLSRRIMDRAADHGITFLDTADVYPLGGDAGTRGRTEEIVGRWLQGQRHRYVIATKCSIPMSDLPWDRGNSRKHILDAIDASLRRLGTDYVDLYQLHMDDPQTPLDETLEALDVVVRAGKARYVGCSNFLAWRMARALGRSEARGLVRFASVQPRYNLLFREFERELFPLCLEEGVGVIPYNPLAGGLLTGKHRRDRSTLDGTRFTVGTSGQLYQDRYLHDREFDAVETIGAAAAAAGIAMTTLAVRWVLAHPAVTSAIIGASRPEQLAENVAALEAPLDEALAAELDARTRQFRHGDAQR
ncbi:MAG: aldo/keto reductase [Gammaproteobacteria bacterium]